MCTYVIFMYVRYVRDGDVILPRVVYTYTYTVEINCIRTRVVYIGTYNRCN